MITRFAPSPTGSGLHIGGARTALFNYLLAKRHGGKFLIRIEDTDKIRNNDASLDLTLRGLEWLGITSDDEPIFQSQRVDRHREVALELIQRGHAYEDYTTPLEMEELCLNWEINNPGKPFRYWNNPWREPETRDSFTPSIEPVVRFKAPRGASITINDMVQGSVTVDMRELDDMILLRSDGTPTYMLAVVVDDHDMGVDHIIRGDDHLNNAFRQLPIYWAMGWEEPRYAHIPLIHNENGNKCSKRDGAAGVMEFADMGILPDAMVNYLLRLGWGHGDDEIISREQAKDWFDITAVNRSPARFDMKKLLSVNAHYLHRLSDEKIATILADALNGDVDLFRKVAPLVKTRAQTIAGIIDLSRTFVSHKLPNEKVDIHRQFNVLSSIDWNFDEINSSLRSLSSDTWKFRDVMAPLRLAITGETISPPLIETMEILGREEVLRRMIDVTQSQSMSVSC